MPRTFGFEAEFINHVPELIEALSDAGFANQRGDRAHQYHCSCDTCIDLHGVVFRAQRDSSCGGEIISGLFFDTPEGWERAQLAMEALQECALDVDAAVDTRCGMHVHLGWASTSRFPDAPELRPDDWAQARAVTLAWIAMEPLLWEHIAGSVWAGRRSNFNANVSSQLIAMMQNNMRLWVDRYPVEERRLHELGSSWNSLYKDEFIEACSNMQWDRHSDFARATHGGVYEFRIFNATRSAWRTELACRLSVAMSKRDFVQPFADKMEEWLFGGTLRRRATRLQSMRNGYRTRSPGDRAWCLVDDLPLTLEEIVDGFRAADDRLGDLIDKQVAYQHARKDLPAIVGLAIANDTVVPGHNRVRETLGV